MTKTAGSIAFLFMKPVASEQPTRFWDATVPFLKVDSNRNPTLCHALHELHLRLVGSHLPEDFDDAEWDLKLPMALP